MKALRMFVASLLLCGTAAAAAPSSINNNDSCDIKVGPAATLLLPYFEVDVSGNSGRTTLVTVTNVTRLPADRACHALERLGLSGDHVQSVPHRL